jgi:hypothetical protein
VEVAVVVQPGEPVGDRQLGEPRVGLGELVGALGDLGLELAVHLEQRLVLGRQIGDQLPVLLGQPVLAEQVLHRQVQAGLIPGLGDVVVEVGAVDRGDHRVEAGLAGQQDLGGGRRAAIDQLEQIDALHAGHDLVGDHHRHRLAVALELVEQLEGVAARGRGRDRALVTEPRPQLLAQRVEHALLVVDAQDGLAGAHTEGASPLGSRSLASP